MGFPRLSLYKLSLDFLRFSWVFLGVPMVFPRFVIVCFYVFLWFPLGFLMFPMVFLKFSFGFPRLSYGFLWVFLCFLLFSLSFP